MCTMPVEHVRESEVKSLLYPANEFELANQLRGIQDREQRSPALICAVTRPVVNPAKPHRKCFAAPMGLFYVRVRRRVHFKL